MELINLNNKSRNELVKIGILFETLVVNALEVYLKKFNRSIKSKVLMGSKDSHFELDGLIPKGIDELEGQTMLEIKLYTNSKNYFRNAKKIADQLNKRIEIYPSIKSVLLIFGFGFSSEEKKELKSKFKEFIKCDFKIWDINDLYKIDKQFEMFLSENISNISEIIVNNAVSKGIQKNTYDWKKVRQTRLKELNLLYKQDELVLFMGAGVSKEAGISDWSDLISDLLVQMIKNKFLDNKIEINQSETNIILNKMKKLNNNTPLLQTALIRAGLGDLFEKEVSKLLYKNISNKNKGTSTLLKSTAKLCLPRRNGVGIRAVVTYNFDDLLEVNLDDYNVKYHSIYSEVDYPSTDELGIYHVHGFLPRNPEDYEQLSESLLVFSEDGYHNLYNDPYSWANIIQLNYLRENTVLMIGLSLTDPNLRRLLAISNRKTKATKHFAIMKRNDFSNSTSDNEIIRDNIFESFNIVTNELQQNFFEQLGIKIIWVDEYKEIAEIIDSIK